MSKQLKIPPNSNSVKNASIKYSAPEKVSAAKEPNSKNTKLNTNDNANSTKQLEEVMSKFDKIMAKRESKIGTDQKTISSANQNVQKNNKLNLDKALKQKPKTIIKEIEKKFEEVISKNNRPKQNDPFSQKINHKRPFSGVSEVKDKTIEKGNSYRKYSSIRKETSFKNFPKQIHVRPEENINQIETTEEGNFLSRFQNKRQKDIKYKKPEKSKDGHESYRKYNNKSNIKSELKKNDTDNKREGFDFKKTNYKQSGEFSSKKKIEKYDRKKSSIATNANDRSFKNHEFKDKTYVKNDYHTKNVNKANNNTEKSSNLDKKNFVNLSYQNHKEMIKRKNLDFISNKNSFQDKSFNHHNKTFETLKIDTDLHKNKDLFHDREAAFDSPDRIFLAQKMVRKREHEIINNPKYIINPIMDSPDYPKKISFLEKVKNSPETDLLSNTRKFNSKNLENQINAKNDNIEKFSNRFNTNHHNLSKKINFPTNDINTPKTDPVTYQKLENVARIAPLHLRNQEKEFEIFLVENSLNEKEKNVSNNQSMSKRKSKSRLYSKKGNFRGNIISPEQTININYKNEPKSNSEHLKESFSQKIANNISHRKKNNVFNPIKSIKEEFNQEEFNTGMWIKRKKHITHKSKEREDNLVSKAYLNRARKNLSKDKSSILSNLDNSPRRANSRSRRSQSKSKKDSSFSSKRKSSKIRKMMKIDPKRLEGADKSYMKLRKLSRRARYEEREQRERAFTPIKSRIPPIPPAAIKIPNSKKKSEEEFSLGMEIHKKVKTRPAVKLNVQSLAFQTPQLFVNEIKECVVLQENSESMSCIFGEETPSPSKKDEESKFSIIQSELEKAENFSSTIRPNIKFQEEYKIKIETDKRSPIQAIHIKNLTNQEELPNAKGTISHHIRAKTSDFKNFYANEIEEVIPHQGRDSNRESRRNRGMAQDRKNSLNKQKRQNSHNHSDRNQEFKVKERKRSFGVKNKKEEKFTLKKLFSDWF